MTLYQIQRHANLLCLLPVEGGIAKDKPIRSWSLQEIPTYQFSFFTACLHLAIDNVDLAIMRRIPFMLLAFGFWMALLQRTTFFDSRRHYWLVVFASQDSRGLSDGRSHLFLLFS